MPLYLSQTARGRITFVNQKFTWISGYSSGDLIGKTHRIVNSQTHEPEFLSDMWRVIPVGDTWQGEVCNKTATDALYCVDTTVVPVHSPDGKILRYVSTRYDIADRKKAEANITRMAARLSGDEFAVLIPSASKTGFKEETVKALHSAVSEGFLIEDAVPFRLFPCG